VASRRWSGAAPTRFQIVAPLIVMQFTDHAVLRIAPAPLCSGRGAGCEVADIAVDDAEQRSDGRLVPRDAVGAHASVHRSPGHHVDGGSLAEILVARNATRWLRL
jgi:hypothetical protein